MSKFCIICGKELIGRQRTLCSDRECHKEWRRNYNYEYYQNNPEKAIEYRQNNREKINEQARKYRQNNREKLSKLSREYYRFIHGLPEDYDFHKESSIEIIVGSWLQEFNIEFEQQYFINFEGKNWTRVDFYISRMNVCLYIDGDYWHSLLEVQERDMRNNRLLEEMGYKVIRLSEAEILNGDRPWELNDGSFEE